MCLALVQATALRDASHQGRLTRVQLLIDKDVDVNAKDGDGKTAYDLAGTHEEIQRALLLSGRLDGATKVTATHMSHLPTRTTHVKHVQRQRKRAGKRVSSFRYLGVGECQALNGGAER